MRVHLAPGWWQAIIGHVLDRPGDAEKLIGHATGASALEVKALIRAQLGVIPMAYL
jgi:hypothetical protein